MPPRRLPASWAFAWMLLCTGSGALAADAEQAVESSEQSVRRPELPAQESPAVQWGAFVDSYYAYDFGRPTQIDRVFLTQAARHNEWNINLAYAEARLRSKRARARLALQAGTSVQALYQGEPNVDPFGGPNLLRLIQEAYGGWQVTDGLWVDAGIFFSHIGSDDFVSFRNINYTRTLLSEFSPDLASGVRVTLDLDDGLSAQFHLINGWQNLVDTNTDKAFGAQLKWSPSRELELVYNLFVGNERQASLQYNSLRVFHEGIVRWSPWDELDLAVTVQYGTQGEVLMAAPLNWYGASLQGRVHLSPSARISARTELFADPGQVIVATASTDGLRASSSSLGFDLEPEPRLLWRTEVRALINQSPIFPARTGISTGSAFAVTSLSVAF